MIAFSHSFTRTRTMSAFVQPTAAFPPAQPDDPNSPVLFKDNISLVQTQITTVRSLAHEALNAMYVTAAPPMLNITLLSLRSYHQQGCLPARVKPRAPSRFVRSITPYPHQYIVGGTRRQSCRVETEHPRAQRVALYYRSWLTTSPSTRSQRTSHGRAISRPG